MSVTFPDLLKLTAISLGMALMMGSAATTSSIGQDASSAASSEMPSAEPAEPSEEQIAAGLTVWKERGGCFNCHGTFGQGGEGGHFPSGPSLRRTQLDTETLHMVIACGLPGTKMPSNLEGAYTEAAECYGETGGPPPEVSPGASLSDQEITDLVAYIETRQVGQRRITKAECIEFYDDADAAECAAYR